MKDTLFALRLYKIHCLTWDLVGHSKQQTMISIHIRIWKGRQASINQDLTSKMSITADPSANIVQISTCKTLQAFNNEVWEENRTLLSFFFHWSQPIHMYRQLLAIGEKVDTDVEYTRDPRYLHRLFYSTHYILTFNNGWTQSAHIHSHTYRCHSRYRGWSLFWTGFCNCGWSLKH